MVAYGSPSILFDCPLNPGRESSFSDDLNVALFKPQECRSRQQESSDLDHRACDGRYPHMVLLSLGAAGDLDCVCFTRIGCKALVSLETAARWSGTLRFGTRYKANARGSKLRIK